MLSDYLIVVPSLIALTTSVIGVASSHFKPEQTRWKYALLVTSIALSLVAAGATIAGQHHILALQAARDTRLASERDQLGLLIQEGDSLLTTLRNQSKPVPIDVANAWAATAEAWLNKELGPSYVQRFRDGSGIVHGEPVNLDEQHQGYWNGVLERVTRLQQFSSELSGARAL